MLRPQITKYARLAILECLDSTRPLGARELLIHAALGGQLTPVELREELKALHEHGFIDLSDISSLNWHAKLRLEKSYRYLAHSRRLH